MDSKCLYLDFKNGATEYAAERIWKWLFDLPEMANLLAIIQPVDR